MSLSDSHASSRHAVLLLTATLILVAVLDRLVLGHRIGLGWALACLALVVGMFVVRRPGWNAGLVFGLLSFAASLVQMFWRPSFSNGVAVIGLMLMLSALTTPLGGGMGMRLLHVTGALVFPFHGWRRGARSAGELAGRIDLPPGEVLVRPVLVVLPAAILSMVFLVLLSGGNSILGNAVGTALRQIKHLRPPGISQMLFWPLSAVMILVWLQRPLRSATCEWMGGLGDCSLPRPGGAGAAVWANRLTLIAVNVVFFFANALDVVYLWLDTKLPDHLTLSEFVHEGTWHLIASVLLTGGVVTLMGCQSRVVRQAPWQRGLTMIWLLQNLFLVASVLLRLDLYVTEFQLTTQRLHLMVFLLLVVAGLVALGIYIWQVHSLRWMIATTSTILFLNFFALQFWDTRRTVAEHNLDAAWDRTEKPRSPRHRLPGLTGAVGMGGAHPGRGTWPLLRRRAKQSP